jgi:hypothetical protein
MKKQSFAPVSLLLGGALNFQAGCVAMDVGIQRYQGLVNETVQYKIPFTNQEKQLFLDEDWRIDNFRVEHSAFADRWIEMNGGDYRGDILVDREDTGVELRETVRYFDLRLVHRKTNGVIWISSIELAPKQADQELGVLLDSYLETLSGNEFHFVRDLGPEVRGTERRFAATLQDRRESRVGAHPALDATISVANLDQLKLDPTHRHAQLRVVLLKVPCPRRASTLHGKRFVPPVLVVVGYRNAPAYFERNLADFDALLGKITFWP